MAAAGEVQDALQAADAALRDVCVTLAPLDGAHDSVHGRLFALAVSAAQQAVQAVSAAQLPAPVQHPNRASLARLLLRLGACAATEFAATEAAAETVLLRHVARNGAAAPQEATDEYRDGETADDVVIKGTPGTDAVACGVAGGPLARALAATVGAEASPSSPMSSLWCLSSAQRRDLPLLLAAIAADSSHDCAGDVDTYLSVAACARAALRLMRTAGDICGASQWLARTAAAWPAPGALLCVLPGGSKAVSADGRGVSVELMGAATDSDFQDIVSAWRAASAAHNATDAAAAAAAVAAEDDSLFFFDTDGAADGLGDTADEHGGNLDAWMGAGDDGAASKDEGDSDGEDEP